MLPELRQILRVLHGGEPEADRTTDEEAVAERLHGQMDADGQHRERLQRLLDRPDEQHGGQPDAGGADRRDRTRGRREVGDEGVHSPGDERRDEGGEGDCSDQPCDCDAVVGPHPVRHRVEEADGDQDRSEDDGLRRHVARTPAEDGRGHEHQREQRGAGEQHPQSAAWSEPLALRRDDRDVRRLSQRQGPPPCER